MKDIKELSSAEINNYFKNYLEQIIIEGSLTAIENGNFLQVYKEYICRQMFASDCEIFFQVNKKLMDYAIVDKFGEQFNINIDKKLFNSVDVNDLAKVLVFAGHTICYAYQSAERDKLAIMGNKKPTRVCLVLGRTKTKFITRDDIQISNFVERYAEKMETEPFINDEPWDIAPQFAKEMIDNVSNLTKDEEVKGYLEVLKNAINKVAYAEYCLRYKVKQNVEEDKNILLSLTKLCRFMEPSENFGQILGQLELMLQERF